MHDDGPVNWVSVNRVGVLPWQARCMEVNRTSDLCSACGYCEGYSCAPSPPPWLKLYIRAGGHSMVTGLGKGPGMDKFQCELEVSAFLLRKLQ